MKKEEKNILETNGKFLNRQKNEKPVQKKQIYGFYKKFTPEELQMKSKMLAICVSDKNELELQKKTVQFRSKSKN